MYLVIGASGAQGGAVARTLARRGLRVRGFGRRREPVVPGSEWVSGDLSDMDALRVAFKDVTHASVTLPLTADAADAARWVANVVTAATEARLERLVFNMSNRVPRISTSVEIFESRRLATDALLTSDVPAVVLCPPVYLENLLTPGMVRAGEDGLTVSYPLAAEHRVAWLSHDDLAAITAAALSNDDVVGAVLGIGGADVVTGTELAAAFSAVLDEAVAYQALPVDMFEHGLAAAMGAQPAARVAATYRWLDETIAANLYDGVPAEVEQTFGVRLTPLRDWIAAQSWEAR